MIRNDKLKSEWIKGYEGRYSISEDGEVYSHSRVDKLGRLYKGKYLKHCLTKDGYHQVRLCDPETGTSKIKYVHRLIAETYISEYSEKLTVDHIDRDKDNNHVDNIRMCTREQNRHYTSESGLPMGVSKNGGGRYMARRRNKYLGSFDTPEQAYAEYLRVVKHES